MVKDTFLEQEILNHVNFVKIIAANIMKSLHYFIELDDLVGAGIIGLIDAMDKFDGSKGVKFKTYAGFRIRGAILDELCSCDWVPVSIRRKRKFLSEAFDCVERNLGRPPEEEEVRIFLGMNPYKFYTLVEETKITELIYLEDLKEKNVKCMCFLDLMEENIYLKELRKMLENLFLSLPIQQKEVISLYYFEELLMKEVGEVLNLSESMVSILHKKAIFNLRELVNCPQYKFRGWDS